jgi:hypothetical protein
MDFHQRLASSGNIATALSDSKRHILKTGNRPESHDWSALQLYIR